MPKVPQGSDAWSVSNLLGYKSSYRESSLPLAFGPNIYLCKPRDLSLSFYPRQPKGSFLPLFWNSLKEISSSGKPPRPRLPLTWDCTILPVPGLSPRRKGVGWKGGTGMSQAPVTWHAPSLPYSPAPPTLTPRRSCKALALTHAPTRPGPFLPPQSPSTVQWPRGRAS